MKLALLFFSILTIAQPSFAKLNVVATTSDVGSLVKEVGGDDIHLEVIAKGTQDPHFIEPKPSFMVKMSNADLLVANGLSLEVGWLPTLIQGSRNPKIRSDAPGHLDLGTLIEPLEIPKGAISRSMGDVHPDGNPHFTLDPTRMGKLALGVAEKLGALDPANKTKYLARAKSFQEKTDRRVVEWQDRLAKTGIKKVVTYHPSLSYFLSRFKIEAAAFLEPKPGVPPTAPHILSVIETVKNEKIKLVLIDNFYDTKIGDRLVKEAPDLKVRSIGIAVGSAPGLETLADVTEGIVKAFEGKSP